jgi:MFS family permease
VGLTSAGCQALSHNAGSHYGFARADWLSGGHGVGIGDWVAPRRDDLDRGVPLGVMLTWPTLRSRADFHHVAVGTACLLVGSAFVLLGVASPPDAWTLGIAAGLVVRVAFLLLGVAALLVGVAVLLDRWPLVRVAFLLFGVAALMGGVAALLAGWTLVGVALLLGPVTALLLGVAFLLDRWPLVGVPFLLFGIAALLGAVAGLLDGWTLMGVAFLLLGIAAPLGGVALLYRPELPRRLVAWLTKRKDLPLAADVTSAISSTWSPRHRNSASPRRVRWGPPRPSPASPQGSEDLIWTAASARRHAR